MKENEKKVAIKQISEEIEIIGGRRAYQDASIISTKHFKSSKWVFQQLTKLGRRPKKKEMPLRTLEIGAINTQLLSCPWLNVRAIDLLKRDPRIEQADFLQLIPTEEYQVHVLLSLSSLTM
jgi:25S rRNA (adenine2142-N1)-methyltransferase